MEGGAIAVIGAGTLGWQIARTFAARGVAVRLFDAKDGVVEAAMARIGREAPEASERLVGVGSPAEAVDGVWLVIEAIPERLEAKRALFTELSAMTGPEVVLATNSSSMRSRLLAEASRFPERLLNTHFYNEPWRRGAVELMTCGETDPAVLARVERFMAACGLAPFVARGESTGFIFNRIWRAIKRESLRVVAEGHATPEAVDRLWCIVMESELGPFARMDRVGLDVVLDIERRYAAESGDPADEPPGLLVEMVERGMLGVKSGRGFYEYEG
ncbi:MAG TPA: 3-hydroxyacyl-CoA dehydrogenase family protein [Thermomicrobiales bacterium]|jgi:3-hydroxybutyryl-CoA dehydrogenase